MPRTPEEVLAELESLGLSGEEIERKVRASKVARTRAHFTKFLKDDTNKPVIVFQIKDWRALREFIKEQPTQEHNPGGPMFEEVLHDTAAAIADKDEARLIENLLLIYKAVRRV